MKALRSDAVIGAFSSLFAAYLRFTYKTLRWKREGMDIAQGVWSTNSGAMVCVWHELVPMGPLAWPPGEGRQALRILISQSADGELITRTMAKCGLGAIRGSSAKKTADGIKNKAGEVAFREMAAWVKSGGAVALTPDGPRGPARVMAPGAPALARLTGAPMLLAGMACKPCLRLETWDKTVIPLPFAKAAIVYDGPVFATRGDDPQALAAEWSARLSALTERAGALVDN